MPQLSVIVPVYNVENYLRPCLDSILAQTLRDIEIICVNDGSTDGSLRILEEYAAHDSRISVITQENKGLSGARNTGINAARAEYITFVDSDDAIGETSAYEKAVSYMDDDVGFVAFGVQIIGDTAAHKRFEKYFTLPHSGKTELTEQVMLQTDVCAPNKIFRRSIIEQNDIRFPEGLWYEDNYFFHAYGSMVSYAYFLPEKWYSYTIRTNSIMSQTSAGNSQKYMDGLRVAQKLADYWQSRGMIDAKRRLFGHVFLSLAAHVFSAACHVDRPRRESILQETLAFALEMKLPLYPEFAYLCRVLQQGHYPQQRIKYCAGLLISKQHPFKRVFKFLGIPLWKERCRAAHLEYLLFSCLPVWRKKLLTESV